MNTSKITVQAVVVANRQKVWDYYTKPEHITKWNFAIDTWHCPHASNDMQVGGRYLARMEAKDGSFGFDFEAVYTEIENGHKFSYTMTDNRTVHAVFNDRDDKIELVITFDAENENPIEMQEQGWQMILNNFKQYTENN